MPEIDYGHQMNPWARPRYDESGGKEDDHREYLEYKREIMEMDEQSAAKADD